MNMTIQPLPLFVLTKIDSTNTLEKWKPTPSYMNADPDQESCPVCGKDLAIEPKKNCSHEHKGLRYMGASNPPSPVWICLECGKYGSGGEEPEEGWF